MSNLRRERCLIQFASFFPPNFFEQFKFFITFESQELVKLALLNAAFQKFNFESEQRKNILEFQLG